MPLYTFSHGEHQTERLAGMSVVTITCHCGEQAQRQSVYPFATGLRDWGGDFHMPSSVRSAIEESNGYKAEAQAILKQETGNGLRIGN